MRLSILGNSRLVLARGAAILVLGGLATGCSSGVERFTDGLQTSSTGQSQSQPRLVRQQSQPEPDLVTPSREETYSINDARSASSSRVERSSLPPVAGTRSSDAKFERYDPEEAAQQAAAPVTQRVAAAETAVDNTVNEATAPVRKRVEAAQQVAAIDPMSSATERAGGIAATAAAKDPAGWSSAKGTTITAREGETVYNLSRRYGVPAKVLTQVNGLDGSGNLQAGQKIVIPTYMYSERAPVSAPDNDPKVADARSSRGARNGEPLKAAELPEPKDIVTPGRVQKAGGGVYVVESGDSLLGIARDNGTTMAAIRNANNMPDDNIRIGQKLVIPGAAGAATVAKTAPAKAVEPVKVAEAAKPIQKEAPAARDAQGRYVVVSGDTLGGIAQRYGVTRAQIRQANNLSDDNVRIGQKLVIPSAGGAVVAKAPEKTTEPKKVAEAEIKKPTKKTAEAETAKPVKVATTPKAAEVDPQKTASTEPVAKKAPVTAVVKEQEAETTVAAVEAAKPAPVAKAESDDNATDSGGKLRWPVKGRVVSGYGKGPGTSRDGIDIQVPSGTPVKAADNGVVIYAGNGLKDFGNTVLVRHDNGLVTVYGHADALKVKRGQTVKRGEQIATSGMSGAADAPKLHFEVRKDASPVDPSSYLN